MSCRAVAGGSRWSRNRILECRVQTWFGWRNKSIVLVSWYWSPSGYVRESVTAWTKGGSLASCYTLSRIYHSFWSLSVSRANINSCVHDYHITSSRSMTDIWSAQCYCVLAWYTKSMSPSAVLVTASIPARRIRETGQLHDWLRFHARYFRSGGLCNSTILEIVFVKFIRLINTP